MAPKRTYETIDLTVDDDDRPSQARRQLPYSDVPSSFSQQEGDGWLDPNEEGAADDIVLSALESGENASFNYQLYGVVDTKIVGVQYYRGLASLGEYVILRRQPNNQYDSNAISVENVQRAQIGHIPRTMASKLSKYMDNGDLKVEGCLSGNIGTYDCPIALKLYGTSDPIERANLRNKMKADRLSSQIIDQKEREAKKRKAEELKKIAAAKKSKGMKGSGGQQWDASSQMGFAGTASSQESLVPSQTFEEMVDGAQSFNPREMGEVVEKFGLDEEALAAMPMADCPSKLATQLLPYQRQALHWLLEKENPTLPPEGSEDAVQLWKRSRNKNVFTNIATNFSIKNQEPKLASGGILSDDMGLGKTLEMIALMISDQGVKEGQCSSTLIIAPLGVMSNWSGQIEQHIHKNHPMKVLIYHGSNKQTLTPETIASYDVIITSYTTLATDYLPRNRSEPPPIPRSEGLFSVKWRRVILDEGHIIRNPQTKAALAATGLLAQSKWVLTGTPIINNLKDLYSLIRFIGLTGGLERLEIFNSILTRPVKAGDPNASLLLQALMATICLRRKKEMSFVDLRLPKISEYIHRVEFQPHEREKYEALQAEAKGLLHTVTHSNSNNGNNPQNTYRHLLEMLLRLRQVCNHWSLCGERISSLLSIIESQKMVDLTPENKLALQQMLQLSIETREDCPICLESLHNPVITRCAHSFGYECIERVIDTQHRCPMCRAEPLDLESLVHPAIDLGESTGPDTPNNTPSNESSSSKIDALLSILQASAQKSPTTKTVIFSQWTSFLDLIQSHLPSSTTVARIDGTLSPSHRDRAMDSFSTSPDCTVLLASLAVCSVGLNLTAANQVILADSWWAPAIEDQAVDRVYRLGQKREVTVWRLVVGGSVEERVLDVQQEKRDLMSRAFREGGDEASGKNDGTAGPGRRGRGGRTGTSNRLADIERLLG